MTNLSILQELQSMKPAVKLTKNYSVYTVENNGVNTKIAIPEDKVLEFDQEIEKMEWDSIDLLVERYNGFFVV